MISKVSCQQRFYVQGCNKLHMNFAGEVTRLVEVTALLSSGYNSSSVVCVSDLRIEANLFSLVVYYFRPNIVS